MTDTNDKLSLEDILRAIFGLIGMGVAIFSLYMLYDIATWETNLSGKVERKTFAASVLEKKTDEVIALYGAPDKTIPLNAYTNAWQYDRITYDSIAGKVDHFTRIEVVGDTAFGTSFY
jgi:hypothetical protein